jgi:hypoxanthine-guanine phosphoribosyltransferase
MSLPTNSSAPASLDAEALYAELLQQVKAGLADAHEPAIVGIHSGGAWLAERLAADLGLSARCGVLDVSFYRDDFAKKGLPAEVKPTQIGFDVAGATLLLVDDVLYTGAPPAPPLTSCSTMAARRASCWPRWWTAASASCPWPPTSSPRAWRYSRARRCA